jgi:YVTN family beta-propeller protein
MIEIMTKLSTGPHPAELGQLPMDSVRINFLSRWISEGAKNDNNQTPYEKSKHRLYVCNQGAGMVSVIDTDAKVVIRNIKFEELGYSSNSKPHDVAVEPDGEFWYVSLINDGKILKFDENYNFIAEADFEAAGLLAMHPSKDLLYVGHTLSIPNVPQTLGAIQRTTMTLETISLPYIRPHALAVDPQGRFVYSASLVDNVFGVIDTESNAWEIQSLHILPGVKKNLIQMNVSPDNRTIYISSQFTNELIVLDVSDLPNISVLDSISVGGSPWHPKFSPDGNRVFVGNNISHSVSVVNTESRIEEAVIGTGDGSDGLAEPHGLVISPDGNYVYLTNRNRNIPAEYKARRNLGDNANIGTVVILNTASNTIEKVLEVEEFPSGLAIIHF